MAEFHVQESSSTRQRRTKIRPKAQAIQGPFFYAPSDDGTDENLLILLHGLGDTHLPFANLGKKLKLPQTAILALRAPDQIPFLYEEAYQWYPSFDALGELVDRPNPSSAFEHLSGVVDHLVNYCSWPINRIHWFGFAQGGSVAAEFVLEKWKTQLLKKGPQGESFASIISISGPLLSYPTLSVPCPTPLLVVYRLSPAGSALPLTAIPSFRKGFSSVKEGTLSSENGGMPASKEEWEPIMRFWSETLSRRLVEGLHEVITGASSG